MTERQIYKLKWFFSRQEFVEKFVRTQTPVIIQGCKYEQFEEFDLSVEAVTKVKNQPLP